jgi:hypothetical protein
VGVEVKKQRPYCPRCRKYDHHDPACPEMFFGGDPTKPRGVPHPAETERLSRLRREVEE